MLTKRAGRAETALKTSDCSDILRTYFGHLGKNIFRQVSLATMKQPETVALACRNFKLCLTVIFIASYPATGSCRKTYILFAKGRMATVRMHTFPVLRLRKQS